MKCRSLVVLTVGLLCHVFAASAHSFAGKVYSVDINNDVVILIVVGDPADQVMHCQSFNNYGEAFVWWNLTEAQHNTWLAMALQAMALHAKVWVDLDTSDCNGIMPHIDGIGFENPGCTEYACGQGGQ